MTKRLVLFAAFAAVTVLMTACQTGAGVVPWAPCDPSADKTGTDKVYAMVCKDGTWVPVMTVGEFIRFSRGERFTVAPLPTRPTTTTTAPSTTTSTSTTTTTAAPALTPAITGLAPATGPAAGTTSVVITGTAFTGATTVTFGGTPGTGLVVNSATQITVIAPAHAAGLVDVLVTTPGGTSANTAADNYTYT